MAEDVHVPPAPGHEERDADDEATRGGDEAGASDAGEASRTAGEEVERMGEAPLDASQSLDDAVRTLEAEVADLRDRLARARADYDNLQKRVARDAAFERERVKARVLEAFLQVYEYSKMAEFEAQRSPGPLAEGVKMMVREFDRMLEAEGLRPIGAVGGPFDARLHEAIGHEPAVGVAPGDISRVIATGYQLGDRVLRYAKVAVAPVVDDESE